MASSFIQGLLLVLLLLAYRMYYVLIHYKVPRRRSADETCSMAVFLGSGVPRKRFALTMLQQKLNPALGGHTTEMLGLLAAIDFARYRPRIYFVSEGDMFSVDKALALEVNKRASTAMSDSQVTQNPEYQIVRVPRARRVHQTLVTTPPSALLSLLFCLRVMATPAVWSQQPVADVLLLNGPGTCFVMCVAVMACRILGLKTPTVIYIESFARVTALSLSGKLVRPVVDRFVVQWPKLANATRKTLNKGWLV